MLCRSSARVVAHAFFVVALLLGVAQRQAFAQPDASTAAASTAAAPAAAAPQEPPPTAQGSGGFFNEPSFLTSAITLANGFGDRAEGPKSGFYPELSNMISGSGWLSIGPGYRHYFADDHAFIDTSAALSWRLYKMGQARFELPDLASGHLALGTQGMWQDKTQVNYFGVGPNVLEDDRSQYRMQTQDVVGYATVTTKDWLKITGRVGWLGHPKLMDPGGTFVRDFPTTKEAFPVDPAVSLTVQPAFLHSEASIAADTRDHRGHPTSGSLYRGALTNYSDRTYDSFTFHTWEAEGLQYVPLADSRVVLAFHGWTVAGNPADGNTIPFYMMPAIGGSRTLRDFHDFQFHDNNLLVAGAESRFAVWAHVDAALFLDTGNVAARYRDLNLGSSARASRSGCPASSEPSRPSRSRRRGERSWFARTSSGAPFWW